MLGVWVNFAAVVVGGLIGTLLRGGIPERFRRTINAGLALCVMLIGMSGALKTSSVLIVIVSVVAGSLLGERLRIEDGLDRMGAWAQRRFTKNDDGFAAGFVNATLLFCVGAMAILGSFNAGLKQDYELLFTKSLLDGISSCMLSVSLGLGVLFSSVPVFVYQGLLSLLAHVIAPLLSDAAIAEITCCGSVMILAIGLNMLHLTKIKTADLLPAVLFAPVLTWAFSFLPL